MVQASQIEWGVWKDGFTKFYKIKSYDANLNAMAHELNGKVFQRRVTRSNVGFIDHRLPMKEKPTKLK